MAQLLSESLTHPLTFAQTLGSFYPTCEWGWTVVGCALREPTGVRTIEPPPAAGYPLKGQPNWGRRGSRFLFNAAQALVEAWVAGTVPNYGGN